MRSIKEVNALFDQEHQHQNSEQHLNKRQRVSFATEDLCASSLTSRSRRRKSSDGHALARGSHPYGVQPMGNKYISTSSSEIQCCRDAGLGLLMVFSDELMLTLLEWLTVNELCSLATVSRAFYVLVHHDELWRSRVLQDFRGEFWFVNSWKETYRCCVLGREKYDTAVPHISLCDVHYYSDYLYHPWYCSSLALIDSWCSRDNIERRSGLSVAQFETEFERPNRPVILTDILTKWKAMERWSFDWLLKNFPDIAMTAGPVDMKIANYVRYAHTTREEAPLYIFDPHFVDKIPQLGSDYSVPDYFQDDFFQLLGVYRPNYRWLVAGPAYSGSTFHIDPNATSAWNAVITGRKKWILYPPHCVPPGVHLSPDASEVATPVSLTDWFINYYHTIDTSDPNTVQPIECICEAGEVMFVPSGWHHCVLNLEPSIAITQNYVSRANLVRVLHFLSERRDQISGVPCNYDLSGEFRRRLAEEHPELLADVDATLAEHSSKRGFWSSLVQDDNDEDDGSFSLLG